MERVDATARVSFPRKLWIMFNVHYAEMLTYRAEVALWAVATCLPLIMMGVWAVAGESGRFPLSQVEVFRYFIAVFLVRQFTISWVIHHFEWLVVSGRLSPMLLHPVDPSIRFILMHYGEQWTRLPFVVLITVVVLYLYPDTLTGGEGGTWWWPGVWNIVLAILATILTFILRYTMQYALSMAAFWYERVSALDAIQYMPFLFLSGLVYPFEVLPDTARTILLWTPFPYTVWFPATLLTGGEVPILRGFAMLIGWTVAFHLLSRWLWHKGLKHYSAMGA